MANIKKLFICPYFGDFPVWMNQYTAHFEAQLKPQGYDILIDTDLEGFKKRVKDKLGVDYPGVAGTGKVFDYRCALGLLYEEELKGYDYWLHTDFDCVYGQINNWMTDEQLSEWDIWSNHETYINGPWTAYRNTERVNKLFMDYPGWKEKMIHPEVNGWVEMEYSRLVENSGLKYLYTFHQGNPYDNEPRLKLVDGKLYQDIKKNGEWEEVMTFHFRRSKKWPL